MPRPGNLPAKALATWAGIVLVVAVASRLRSASPLVRPDVIAAALFLYAPLLHYRRRPAPSWIRVGDLRRSAVVLAALLAVGAAVFFGYSRVALAPALAPPQAAAMPTAGEFIFRQAVLAAIPEEAFFRG